MYRKEAYELIAQHKDNSSELYHHGIKGQKWGVRNYQNEDGSYTEEGKKRYGYNIIVRDRLAPEQKRIIDYREMRDKYKEYRKQGTKKEAYQKLQSEYSKSAVKKMKKVHKKRAEAAVATAMTSAFVASYVFRKGKRYIKAAANSSPVRYVNFEDVTNAVDKALVAIH